jgi:hypothetical protein
MDIGQIQEFLTKILTALGENKNAPTDTILSAVQLQLLLHIYHKLEDVEKQLIGIDRNQP